MVSYLLGPLVVPSGYEAALLHIQPYISGCLVRRYPTSYGHCSFGEAQHTMHYWGIMLLCGQLGRSVLYGVID
jgi:hypothetical protein